MAQVSINDHIQNTLPRSSVYSFAQGSDLFHRQDLVEIYPDNSAGALGYSYGADKKISFILSSPVKNQMCDLRSHYIKFFLRTADSNNNTINANTCGVAEPAAENIIDQVVIRCGDTIVEDIRYYNNLSSAFRRSLMGREVKKSNWVEGWDLADSHDGIFAIVPHASGGGKGGKEYIAKLNMSGVLNNQVLQAMHYMPLTIDIYLADPRKIGVTYNGGGRTLANYWVQKPRFCCTILQTSPLYVESLVQAMTDPQNPGLRWPFDTFYSYYRDVDGDQEFFIKIPKKFVRGMYLCPVPRAAEANGGLDAFRMCAGIGTNNLGIVSVRMGIGTQMYRQIDIGPNIAQWDHASNDGTEFYHLQLYGCGVQDRSHNFTSDMNRANYIRKYFMPSLNLDLDPDNSVSSVSTLNDNNVAVLVRCATGGGGGAVAGLRAYTFIHYLASIVVEKGGMITLLDK